MIKKALDPVIERIEEIIEYSGSGSLNIFALNKLKYASSSKLNRFMRENKPPSLDIILDIVNAFPEIDLNWLLLGKGQMIYTTNYDELVKEAIDDQENKNTRPEPGIRELMDAIEKGFNSSELVKTLKDLKQILNDSPLDSGKVRGIVELPLKDHEKDKSRTVDK